MQTGNTRIRLVDSFIAWVRNCGASTSPACAAASPSITVTSIDSSVSNAVANGLVNSAATTSGSDSTPNGSWVCTTATPPTVAVSSSSPATRGSRVRGKVSRSRSRE